MERENRTITGELPTTPEASFNQYSKVCPYHSLLKKPNKFGCKLTGENCNRFNCPVFTKDKEFKKKKKHPFPVSRRYRKTML